MNKAVLVAAALVLAPIAVGSQELPQPGQGTPPGEQTERLLQSGVKDRIIQMIDKVADACAADVDDFCGRVTAGGGRVSLCMQAHEDQLSSGCRSALHSIKRNVESTAEACLSEIKTVCGETEKLGQCLGQKKGSLSPACQTIVAVIGQKARGLVGLVGMPVYSSDNKNLGQVVDVVKGSDNKVQSIQVDIGRALGIGTKVITITSDKLERSPGIEILLSEEEVRSLPEAKK
jgi:hypothetical protein